MESPPLKSSSIGPGSWMGPYRIFEVLGAGAFGTVFRAAQVRPFRRTVAIKVLNKAARLCGEEALARFETERQATASLTHSAIAQIFDAGSLGDGTPYFVMEYVPGIRITDFCDKHKLTLRQRCELFLTICDGIAYAHAIGIVHRDLTPSNVLAFKRAGSPTAKVIDFGIAKIMHNALPHWGETLTAEGQLLGTPGYMSPEQASHASGQLDGRADVYGLGALLYELLTGLSPIPQQEIAIANAKGIGALVDLIKSFVPKKASERLGDAGTELIRIAECRSCSPADLRRTLAREFDTLLSSALELNPLDRPKSADALRDLVAAAMDKTRIVQPTTRSSVAIARWARSPRGVVTLTALALAAVLVVGSTAWNKIQDRQNARIQDIDKNFVRLYWTHANLLGEIQLLAKAGAGPAKAIWDTALTASKGKQYLCPYDLLNMPDRNTPEDWKKPTLIIPEAADRAQHLLNPDKPERQQNLIDSISFADRILSDLRGRFADKLDDSQDPATFDVVRAALRDRESKLLLGDSRLGAYCEPVDAPRQHIGFVLEGRALYKGRLDKVNALTKNWRDNASSSSLKEILSRLNTPTPASLRVLLVKRYANSPGDSGVRPSSLDELRQLLEEAESRCEQSLKRLGTLAGLLDSVFKYKLPGFEGTLLGEEAREALIAYLSDAGTSLPSDKHFDDLNQSLQTLDAIASRSKTVHDYCAVLDKDLGNSILRCYRKQLSVRTVGDQVLDGPQLLDRAGKIDTRQIDELYDILAALAARPPNPSVQSDWLKNQPSLSIDELCSQLKTLPSP